MTRTIVLALMLALAGRPATAQESKFHADLGRERKELAAACKGWSMKGIGSCGYALTTLNPFHIALGNMAPENGFAFGLGFAERFTPNEAWRISWNGDAVASTHGAWRAGLYMKMIHTPATSGADLADPNAPPGTSSNDTRSLLMLDVFFQTTSLSQLSFYGLGPDSLEGGRALFGQRQTFFGGALSYPLSRVPGLGALRPSLGLGVTARFVDIRDSSSTDAPRLDELYDESTAPGLTQQKPYVEFRESLRLRPSLANGWLKLNYAFSAQQFRATSDIGQSFNRWTLDLRHEIPLFTKVGSTGPREFNGPNECTSGPSATTCPPVTWSRNRQGSVMVRGLLSAGTTRQGDQVPFYFQPTLGGSTIDGDRVLASFADYRFRDRTVMLVQEGIEYSLWGPFGVAAMLEQGAVADAVSRVSLGNFRSSASVGFTIRAGGLPLISFSYSWGSEGGHLIGAMSPTLLGGSARPSLF